MSKNHKNYNDITVGGHNNGVIGDRNTNCNNATPVKESFWQKLLACLVNWVMTRFFHKT